MADASDTLHLLSQIGGIPVTGDHRGQTRGRRKLIVIRTGLVIETLGWQSSGIEIRIFNRDPRCGIQVAAIVG